MAKTHVFTPSLVATATSTTPNKAYTGAVSAGDLLWCFTWQRGSVTTTCSGVSDTVNGSWTQAFGPRRIAVTASDYTLYGFYKPNSGAGTPTVTATWSESNPSMVQIGAINGCTGGGALDQEVHAELTSSGAAGWAFGTTAALAQAEEAGVATIVFGSGTDTPVGFTADVTIDSFNVERGYRITTASTSAITLETTAATTGGTACIAGFMFFKDAAAAIAPALTSATLLDGRLFRRLA